jgi:sterol desaturase/sphingolipid hydroxylase (fatty acid hydroxylase superfamily)
VSWAILSPAVIAASALLLGLLERRWPYDRGQSVLREGFWTDLVFYTLLQSYVLALVISASIRWVDGATGVSDRRLLASWPVSAQVAFFVVAHDLYIYWFHRWQHASPVLWRLHEAHHSAEAVDWLAGARSHALEILINQTVEFGPLLLLGADPSVPLIKGMISAVWGLWIHANVGVRTGWLQHVVNGPEMHRWHHAVDLAPPGRNFATKLAVWDWLFGTAWHPPGRKPSAYGLTDVAFPKGYVGQQLFAFRRHEAVTPPTPKRQPPRPGSG